MGRAPAPRPAAPGADGVDAPRPQGGVPGAPRPGGPRPNPGMMPPRPRPGPGPVARSAAVPAVAGRPGGRPGGPGGAGGGGFAGRPGGPVAPGGGGGGGGYAPRPGGGAPGGGGGFPGRPGGGRQPVVAVAARPVPSAGPGVARRVAARARSSGVRSSTTCRPRRSAACWLPRGDGDGRPAAPWRLADRLRREDRRQPRVARPGHCSTSARWSRPPSRVNDDTLQLLGAELNFDVQVVSPEDEDRELLESLRPRVRRGRRGEEAAGARGRRSSPSWVTSTTARPSCSTPSAHANVVAGEAGGITQHIGAYQVSAEHRRTRTGASPSSTPRVTRRSPPCVPVVRKVTDIAILVVAADDGVKPQTIEALNHAQAADVPIVVAVNKIDKEGADPDKVRGQLTEYGLVAEEYGGDTMFVDVSAKPRHQHRRAARGRPAHRRRLARPAGQPRRRTRRVWPSRPTSTRAAVRWPPCSSSAARCAPATRSSSARRFGRVRAMLDENGDTVEEARSVAPGPGPGSDLGARRR